MYRLQRARHICGAQDEYLFKIVNRQLLFDRDLTMRKQ